MRKYTTETISTQIRGSLEEIAREGAARLLGCALEAEVEEYLMAHGRSHKNGTAIRNGYAPDRTLLSGIGPIPIRAPRVDDREEREQGKDGFYSHLLPKFARKTPSVETVLPALYLAGVSMKDMAKALAALVGEDAKNLSASVIQRTTLKWQSEHELWCQRDLSEFNYVYWWADGIHLNIRLEDERSCLLVILGADSSGKKGLVALQEGFVESAANWKEILLDLRRRGLSKGPMLGTADGALGFWKAMEEVFPSTRKQRCWVHKIRNVLEKLPKHMKGKAKAALHDIMLAKTRKHSKAALHVFVEAYQNAYPKAAKCLTDDEETLLAFYDFPAAHWKSIRTTNPIESTFATVRLRTAKTRGMGTRATALAMSFKLIQKAEGGWNRLRGFKEISDVLKGVIYIDGEIQQQKAA
jgi:putative transposase